MPKVRGCTRVWAGVSALAVGFAACASVPSTACAAALLARPAAEDAATAVLGLDTEAVATGDALTRALRKAFSERGVTRGQEVTLLELRLALGCEGNDPACLASGGPTLLADRMVYGVLQKDGASYTVELALLDVPSKSVTASARETLSASDLVPDAIDATATKLVSQLIGPSDEPAVGGDEPTGALPGPIVDDDPPPPPPPDDELPSDGLIARPVPAWKWAGLGVGVGVTAIGLTLAIVGGVQVSRQQQNIFDAADASLEDCVVDGEVVTCEGPGDTRFVDNDIDPDMDGDLCGAAAVTGTDPTNPSAVVNADVHNACERGAVAERVNIAGFALLGVGVAATAAFTALLFFPRRGKRESASRWRRREPMVGLSPSRGGAFVSGSFRF